jgi:acyl-ACP thioesterase
MCQNNEEHNMDNIFEQSYKMRYFEMNKHGIASPTTILTLLEETAAEHCNYIGYNLYNLEKQDIGWVLISGTIDMIRYPKYSENITIKTWLSKYSLIRGYRENTILDEENNIIGNAKGIWVFYDIKKRKPTPIFENIRMNWGIKQETSVEMNLDLIDQPSGDGSLMTEFNVYRSDVDSNNHVNNIRYFHFLLESLPEEMTDKYYLKTINAKFLSEAKFGENIQVYINDKLGGCNFMHTMKSNIYNTTLAKAHTQWEKI